MEEQSITLEDLLQLKLERQRETLRARSAIAAFSQASNSLILPSFSELQEASKYFLLPADEPNLDPIDSVTAHLYKSLCERAIALDSTLRKIERGPVNFGYAFDNTSFGWFLSGLTSGSQNDIGPSAAFCFTVATVGGAIYGGHEAGFFGALAGGAAGLALGGYIVAAGLAAISVTGVALSQVAMNSQLKHAVSKVVSQAEDYERALHEFTQNVAYPLAEIKPKRSVLLDSQFSQERYSKILLKLEAAAQLAQLHSKDRIWLDVFPAIAERTKQKYLPRILAVDAAE